MLQKCRLCRFFVKLKRNNIIRLEHSGKLAGHYNGVSAVGAVSGARCFIGNNFAAAAFAGVHLHSVCFAVVPLLSCAAVPVHFVLRVCAVRVALLIFQRFNAEFGIAIGTFHLLD